MERIIYIDPDFADALNDIPKEISREQDLSADIALRIDEILKRKDWSHKDLAKAMGKKDSEISKWMSGQHNFTISTIARIETVLGEDILSVKRYRKKVTGYDQMPQEKRKYLSEKMQIKYGTTRKKDQKL